MRRALPGLAERIALGPGAPRYFLFALQPPARGWPTSIPGELEVVPLADAVQGLSAALSPALVFARAQEPLDALASA